MDSDINLLIQCFHSAALAVLTQNSRHVQSQLYSMAMAAYDLPPSLAIQMALDLIEQLPDTEAPVSRTELDTRSQRLWLAIWSLCADLSAQIDSSTWQPCQRPPLPEAIIQQLQAAVDNLPETLRPSIQVIINQYHQ